MKPVVVITRFNIAVKYRYKKLYAGVSDGCDLWLDEDYLERRFELFEKYTFPSFCAQSDHEFRWVVLFHKDTPSKFRLRIENYQSKLGEFEPWYLDDEESERFADVVNERLQMYNNTGVITIRVDNDDAIHRTFIAAIKQGFKDCNEMSALTFPLGLQYDTIKRKIMRYSYINNHFMALYTGKGTILKNILSFQHTDIDRILPGHSKIIKKTKLPMWIEIVSETNCVNEIWTRPSKLFVPFCVKDEYPMLDLKWSTRFQWIGSIILNLPVSVFRMFVDCVILIFRR